MFRLRNKKNNFQLHTLMWRTVRLSESTVIDKSTFRVTAAFLAGKAIFYLHHIKYEPRSDKRDLLAIKVKSEKFTETERPSCCEQLQKI